MLELKHRKLLFAAIHGAFDLDALEQLLWELGKKTDDFIPGQTTLSTAIRRIVEAAVGEGWLLELLDALEATHQENQNLQEAVRRVREATAPRPALPWYPDAPPTQAVFVKADPFFDRDPLRGHLETLLQGQSQRILVVEGGVGSGKTYTRRLVHHLAQPTAEQPPRFVAVYVDFTDWDPIKPRDVMKTVAMEIDVELADRVDTFAQDSNQNIYLVTWLKGLLTGDRPDLWLMFDHSRKAPPGEEVKALIKLLVREVTAGALPKLRLLFLDWEKPLQAQALREELRLLQVRDVRKGFEHVAQSGGHQVAPAAVEEEVSSVTAGLGDRFLPSQVCEHLLPACERLFAPSPPAEDGP